MALLAQYQSIANRLKKKRILKTSSIAEILEQFEVVGGRAEGIGEEVTAGLCYKAAAGCAATLHQYTHCATLLLRAARLLIRHPHHTATAHHCYTHAIQRYGEVSSAMAGAVCCELAKRLVEEEHLGAGLLWLQRAAVWLAGAPVERLHCHADIIQIHVKMGNLWEALETCRDAVNEAMELPVRSADISRRLRELQITRVLLLLLLQLPTPQMNEADRGLLEELTWGADSSAEGSRKMAVGQEEMAVLQSCLHERDSAAHVPLLPASFTSLHLSLIRQLHQFPVNATC